MSLDQLQAVVTIAEEGTLVRAARRLRISQPPLTRKVRALEEELGVPLFDRGARGMRPTPAGHALLGAARAILAAVDAAAEGARAAAPAREAPALGRDPAEDGGVGPLQGRAGGAPSARSARADQRGR